MALSQARLEAIFEINATDNSARVLDKTEKRLDGIGKRAGKVSKQAEGFGDAFAEAGDQAAERAGKLSTALSSLGDFAGGSESQFRKASEAAGAFDDVLTLLPGPIGVAAAAVAGLATVLVLNRKEAERNRQALQASFSGQLLQDVKTLQERFSLTTEASIELGKAMEETGKNAGDVAGELGLAVRQAERLGEEGSKGATEFAQALAKTATEADKAKRAVRGLRGLQRALAEDLSDPEQIEANRKADQAALDRITGLRRAIRQLKADRDQLTAAAVEGDTKAKQAQQDLNRTIDTFSQRLRQALQIRERFLNTIAAEADENRRLRREETARETAEDVAALKRDRKAKRAAARARARAAAQRRRNKALAEERRLLALVDKVLADEEATRRKAAEAAKIQTDTQRENLEARVVLLRQLKAPLDDIAAAERRLAFQRDQERRTAVESLVAAGKLTDEQAQQRLDTLNRLHSAELLAIDERVDKEKKKRTKGAQDTAKAQIEAVKQVLAESTSAIGQGADLASQVVGGLSAGVQEATTQFKDVGKVAPNALTAIGKAGAAFIKNERARAAILAVTSAADALRAAATPGGQVQAALLGAAAVQYGLVAAGVLGGTPGGGVPQAGAAATIGAGGGAELGGERVADGGAGRVTNITFQGLFATQAQVAQALQQTSQALNGTGFEVTP
jgi:colicin import membrane protein